jgi:hypothetical protein
MHKCKERGGKSPPAHLGEGGPLWRGESWKRVNGEELKGIWILWLCRESRTEAGIKARMRDSTQ